MQISQMGWYRIDVKEKKSTNATVSANWNNNQAVSSAFEIVKSACGGRLGSTLSIN